METVTVSINRGALSKQIFSSIRRMFLIVLSNSVCIIIINLFNVDINITIKIIYRKKEKDTSLYENKANRCQLKNKTVKIYFF